LTAATASSSVMFTYEPAQCGREVGPPVLMGDNYARPCAFGPSERTGIGSTSRKDCLRSNPKFEQRRTTFRADQVTEQQEVDNVAGPVVDRRRRVMWIGACVELLARSGTARPASRGSPGSGVRILREMGE
jgi:hypothetical protein